MAVYTNDPAAEQISTIAYFTTKLVYNCVNKTEIIKLAKYKVTLNVKQTRSTFLRPVA